MVSRLKKWWLTGEKTETIEEDDDMQQDWTDQQWLEKMTIEEKTSSEANEAVNEWSKWEMTASIQGFDWNNLGFLIFEAVKIIFKSFQRPNPKFLKKFENNSRFKKYRNLKNNLGYSNS